MKDETVRIIGHVGLLALALGVVALYHIGYADRVTMAVVGVIVPFNMALLEIMYRVERLKEDLGV